MIVIEYLGSILQRYFPPPSNLKENESLIIFIREELWAYVIFAVDEGKLPVVKLLKRYDFEILAFIGSELCNCTDNYHHCYNREAL